MAREKDVRLHQVYKGKVSGKLVDLEVIGTAGETPSGRTKFLLKNLATNRTTKGTAGKLKQLVRDVSPHGDPAAIVEPPSRGRPKRAAAPLAENPRPPKGEPTHTNLYVLGKYAEAGRVPPRVPASEFQHLRRCMAAGLVAPDGEITPAGYAALGRTAPEQAPPPPPPDPSPLGSLRGRSNPARRPYDAYAATHGRTYDDPTSIESRIAHNAEQAGWTAGNREDVSYPREWRNPDPPATWAGSEGWTEERVTRLWYPHWWRGYHKALAERGYQARKNGWLAVEISPLVRTNPPEPSPQLLNMEPRGYEYKTWKPQYAFHVPFPSGQVYPLPRAHPTAEAAWAEARAEAERIAGSGYPGQRMASALGVAQQADGYHGVINTYSSGS